MHASLLAHIETILSELIAFTHPADAILSQYFRRHPQLGVQDRFVIAEVTFTSLRHYTQLLALITPDKPNPRRLALATLVRYRTVDLRHLAPVLTKHEQDWVNKITDKRLPTTLVTQTGFPEWVIDRLPPMSTADLSALGQGYMHAAPLDLRVNILKMKRDTVLTALNAEGIEASATPYSPLGIRLLSKKALHTHPFVTQGVLDIQDEGSQLIGLLTGARRGERIVDFCAGAGGKTLLLGAQMASTGRVYAFDISEKRLANFKPRLMRSGLTNVHIQRIAHENDAKIQRLAQKIDRVLVDAPCSGLGTLRRHPDLKFRQNAQSVRELAAKQSAILNAASHLVKAKGSLVYATCSFLPEENQQNVASFLASHPNFALVPVDSVLAELGIALETGDFLELAPHRHNTDGFFAAVLRRTA